ncbi:hypothetical protein FEM48_Zijuj10G0063900 [Ziziphus jujuba var. spinosa]|uniref:Uncharacterized protein n=1 Tax=Ziziphus jujuba var. spinosa TaxID=714518 RepID=A0A978ULT9_ZIZJJ|nr:hypothetical protein FEM48_Zijuj10G0063900 [Ziziphus jujuba var. spinosa]
MSALGNLVTIFPTFLVSVNSHRDTAQTMVDSYTQVVLDVFKMNQRSFLQIHPWKCQRIVDHKKRSHGKAMEKPTYFLKFILILNPGLKHMTAFPKFETQALVDKLLGDGHVNGEGETWAKLRKPANHAFHRELGRYDSRMISRVETMLVRWKLYEGQKIEVFEKFRLLTPEMISRAAFRNNYLQGNNIFDMLMRFEVKKFYGKGDSNLWDQKMRVILN